MITASRDLKQSDKMSDIDLENLKVNNQVKSVDSSDAQTTEPSIITEGKAEVVFASSKNVFYNPVQEFNRDLSIAVLRLIAEDYNKLHNNEELLLAGTKYIAGLTILEALSASGLRSIRYAKEIPGIKEIVANDISPSAVASIQANAARNTVEHLVTASHNDATLLMHEQTNSKKFQAIDLDPYGCPSQFLDAAVQCVDDGGVLLVTCTDMGVLSGNSPETCYSKYGAISMRVPPCHEMALRIVLQCIESHANRHGRYIEPLLSISADFYIRVFVKVFTSVNTRPLDKLAMIHHCVGCHTITLQPIGSGPTVSPQCEHCKQKHSIGGPIWSAPIHDQSFVRRLQAVVQDKEFGTSKRLQGMLAVIQEELNDVCLYYTLDKISLVVHADTMPMLKFRSALMNAGYRVSYSHASKTSVKTDAPARVIWDIMRYWVCSHPVSENRLIGAARAILAKEPSTEISFEWRTEANPASRQQGLTRYQANPQPFWGPGTRAKSNPGQQIEKKKRNQNRYKKKRILMDIDNPPCKYIKSDEKLEDID